MTDNPDPDLRMMRAAAEAGYVSHAEYVKAVIEAQKRQEERKEPPQ